MKIEIDIGDLCTHCGRDTSPNSGNSLFIDHISDSADGEIVAPNMRLVFVDCQPMNINRTEDYNSVDVKPEVQLVLQGGNPPHEDPPHISIELPLVVGVNGVLCVECQAIQCDKCGIFDHNYDHVDEEIVCSECLNKPKGGDEGE